MKTELNKALKENQQLKNMFSPDKVVEAMTKAVGAMTAESPLFIIKGDSVPRSLKFYR